MQDPEALHEPSESTADRLLSAAATMFRRKGYAGSSTREIAALLGIQKASLYHHIAKKEDLLYEICMDCLTQITREVERAMAPLSDPLARLTAMIAAHVRVSLADQDKFATVLSDMRELSDDRRAEVMRLHDAYEALVERAIAAAQRSGALRTDISPRHQTLLLLNLLNWPAFWFRPTGELSPVALTTLLTRQFLEGAQG